MNSLSNELATLKSSLFNYINIMINDNIQYVSELSHSPVLENYDSVLSSYKDNVEVLEARLSDSVLSSVETKSLKLSALAGKLNALSPLAVLARGYSVAQKNNEIIKSVSDINENDEIHIAFSDGGAICKVNEVVENG